MSLIPKQSGTYVLWLRAEKALDLVVGKLGHMHIEAGYYAYIGSAFGPGGLAARLGRHLKQEKSLRWHIDYLRQYTEPCHIWYTEGKRMEHAWATQFERNSGVIIPMPGFGSSDCQCPSHLFYSPQYFTLKLKNTKHIPVE